MYGTSIGVIRDTRSLDYSSYTIGEVPSLYCRGFSLKLLFGIWRLLVLLTHLELH